MHKSSQLPQDFRTAPACSGMAAPPPRCYWAWIPTLWEAPFPSPTRKPWGARKPWGGGRGRTQEPHPHSRGWLKGDVTNENYIVSDLVSLC